MAFSGKLEVLTPPEIFQLVSLTRKSGKLVLTNGDRQGVLVFKDGRVVFAASDAMRSTFSSALATGRVVSDTDFLDVKRTTPGAVTESGGFLVEVRESMAGSLQDLVHEQIERTARELVGWRSGTFDFETFDLPEIEDLCLDRGWFLAEEGVGPEELLLGALTKLDEIERGEWQRDLDEASESAEENGGEKEESDSEISAAFEVLIDEDTGEISWAPVPSPTASEGRDLAHLRRLVGEMEEMRGMSPTLTAEVTLLILRYAAQIVNRGVLFAVRSDGLQGIGQFGLRSGPVTADQRVRDLRIPLGASSVLQRVLESHRSFRGRPEPSLWNDFLADRLGGGRPYDVVAMPLVVDDGVVAVFYGDNMPGTTLIGAMDGLEILMREIGLAVEKARLEQRLAALGQKPDSH